MPKPLPFSCSRPPAPPALRINLHPAHGRSVRLDNRALYPPDSLKPYQTYRNLTEQEWFITLYHNFNTPPYRLPITDNARQALWTTFCATVGLHSTDRPHVFGWVRHQTRVLHTAHTASPPLSNYFDDGLEWWGVCA